MSFKEKVMKVIVEIGEEKTIAEISNAMATRAFFELKKKFELLEKEMSKKQESCLIKRIDAFEITLKKTVEEEVKKQR